MKTHAHHLLTLLLVIAGMGLIANSAEAADTARVTVILVEASNPADGKSVMDPALKPYARNLQRILRFGSYKQVSKSSMRLKIPGEGKSRLAGGQELVLKANDGSSSGIMAELTWTRGGKRLLHTRIQLRPGNPAVLGGPRSNGGTQMLLLVLE